MDSSRHIIDAGGGIWLTPAGHSIDTPAEHLKFNMSTPAGAYDSGRAFKIGLVNSDGAFD